MTRGTLYPREGVEPSQPQGLGSPAAGSAPFLDGAAGATESASFTVAGVEHDPL